MGIRSLFQGIGKFLGLKRMKYKEGVEISRNVDRIFLNLDGLRIHLQRGFSYDIPHEVTIVIPRAEFRKRIWKGKDGVEEHEIILSSITIVHSPIRPPMERSPGASSFPSAAKDSTIVKTKKGAPRSSSAPQSP